MEKLEISISMAGVPQIAHGIFKNENFHGGIGKYSAEMAVELSVLRSKQEDSREIRLKKAVKRLVVRSNKKTDKK